MCATHCYGTERGVIPPQPEIDILRDSADGDARGHPDEGATHGHDCSNG